MPYLVDGNNLLGAARDRKLGLPATEEELIRALAAFAHARRASLTLVLDGPRSGRRGAGGAGSLGGVIVRYSGAGRTADDLILEMAERSGNPRDIVLVTADRALRAGARGRGCRVMGCAEFAARLSATRSGPAPSAGAEDKPLPGDIEEWERYFSSRGPRGSSG